MPVRPFAPTRAAILALALLAAPAAAELVVRSVESGAAAAGLKAGDVLVAAGNPQRPLENPFDLIEMEIEQASRAPARMEIRRGATTIELALGFGAWGFVADPPREAEALAAADAESDPERRATILRSLAERALARGDRAVAAWLYVRLAKALVANDLEAAIAARRSALVAAGRDARLASLIGYEHGNSLLAAQAAAEAEDALREAEAKAGDGTLFAAAIASKRGAAAHLRGDLDAAERHFERCLSLRQAALPAASLDVAAAESNLGVVASARGDLESAERRFQATLAIRERLAPGSREAASTLVNLGLVKLWQGDLDAAERHLSRGFEVLERLLPESAMAAAALNNLGMVASDRGDLAEAERRYLRSLAIRERLFPGRLPVAESLNNLGLVRRQRGDFAGADECLTRAIEIKEREAPDSINVASTVANLGDLHLARGEIDRAADSYTRALRIYERDAPGSLDVAAMQANLGSVALQRGDRDEARRRFELCLEVREQIAPDGLEVSEALASLAEIAIDEKRWTEADAALARMALILAHTSPGSLAEASVWYLASRRETASGDLERSRRCLLESIAIRSRLAPGSVSEAQTWHELGRVARALGRRQEGLDAFCRAVEALEIQAARLGGTEEARQSFAAMNAALYRDWIEALLAEGRDRDAFDVLERSRARSLLAMLAERDLVLGAEIPGDLDRERKLADAEHDRLGERIGEERQRGDAAAAAKLEQELAANGWRQAEIRRKLRRAAPRLASLRYPEPLDTARVLERLDPGLVVLAYSVGESTSTLFVLEAGGSLRSAAIPIGRAALRGQVLRLRNAWTAGVESANARELTEWLLAPARTEIARAKRLLILPDGPLHFLPFSALFDPAARAGSARYLVEAVPSTIAVSATVWDELRQGRKATAAGRIVAFGDPIYAPGPSALYRGEMLEPLPATRDEVVAIARLDPVHTQAVLGEDATEANARELAGAAAVLHFACHGMIDEEHPLESALALSAPRSVDGTNGLLQAWEIFESIRLDAELVTLSACQSALGRELAGEGLVGLTRAFQFAGARSVLASLWSVADRSTAELMARFYAELRAGKPKDEALRIAQTALLRGEAGTGSTAPFHWAAFTLVGDWR